MFLDLSLNGDITGFSVLRGIPLPVGATSSELRSLSQIPVDGWVMVRFSATTLCFSSGESEPVGFLHESSSPLLLMAELRKIEKKKKKIKTKCHSPQKGSLISVVAVNFITATDTNLSEWDTYHSGNYETLRWTEICYNIFLASWSFGILFNSMRISFMVISILQNCYKAV